MDVMLAGGFSDGEGVGEGDGERLLDHDGDSVAGGGFNGLAMSGDGGVNEQSLGMGGFDHLVSIGEEEALRQGELFCIFRGKRGIGVGDAYQLHVFVLRQGGEKAFHVAVDESYDGDPERGGLGLRQEGAGQGGQQDWQEDTSE